MCGACRTTSPSRSRSWQKLASHYLNLHSAGTTISQLFTEDPQRFEHFSLRTDALFLDYSKNLMTAETRELLLDSFRDAADFWSERKIAFRVFYSIAVSGKESAGNWDRAEIAQNDTPVVVKATKVSKNAQQPMTMNLPPMSSAFDTAILLDAA